VSPTTESSETQGTIDETVDQISKIPKAPPQTATKEEKLKYLEDLENNLKKT
jgi:hypothetical protein